MPYISRNDADRERAASLSARLAAPTVTTAWVLTEVADAMAEPLHRRLFADFLRLLRADPHTMIVPASEEMFQEGLLLYEDRPDQDWPLTDCISFVVMEQMRITEALTADHHFEQAGFVALLR